MTDIRFRFGETDDDILDPYELEIVSTDGAKILSHESIFVRRLVARRLLVDLLASLRSDANKYDGDLIPEAFLDRLDEVTRDLADEGRSMGQGTEVRLEAINEIRETFGFSTLPERKYTEDLQS